MKKKSLMVILAAAMMISVLSGCGDGSEPVDILSGSQIEIPDSNPVTISSEPVFSTPQPEDAGTVRLLHFAGDLTQEEEAAAMDAMQTLYQNLEIPEYLGEAIHMIAAEEWLEAMTAGTYAGSRSYSLQQGELALLTVQIGEDSTGLLYSDVCFQDAHGRMILLKQFGTVTQLLVTGTVDGAPDGAFESWRIDSSVGEIIWEKGTYAKGTIVGEHTTSAYVGVEGDAFDLWTNREGFTYTVSTTIYDDQGNPVSTPTPEPTATPTAAPTAKPTATPKPAAAATPKPAKTPAPTPVPTQEPEDDDDEDDDDEGYVPQPDPTEEPAAPPQGGDVDQEWSPDLD